MLSKCCMLIFSTNFSLSFLSSLTETLEGWPLLFIWCAPSQPPQHSKDGWHATDFGSKHNQSCSCPTLWWPACRLCSLLHQCYASAFCSVPLGHCILIRREGMCKGKEEREGACKVNCATDFGWKRSIENVF